jgi:hypothetical protein
MPAGFLSPLLVTGIESELAYKEIGAFAEACATAFPPTAALDRLSSISI